MTATRREWMSELTFLHQEMERLLRHYAGAKPPMVQFAKRVWEPAIDVYETAEEVVIIAEIAGVEAEAVEKI